LSIGKVVLQNKWSQSKPRDHCTSVQSCLLDVVDKEVRKWIRVEGGDKAYPKGLKSALAESFPLLANGHGLVPLTSQAGTYKPTFWKWSSNDSVPYITWRSTRWPYKCQVHQSPRTKPATKDIIQRYVGCNFSCFLEMSKIYIWIL